MTRTELDIVLIEDNPGDVRLIEEMLQEQSTQRVATNGTAATVGREIRHASDLENGLELLETRPVDVVLLDLGLPGTTGIETLETLREHSRDVPVVVLTGQNDERIGDEAVQQGAQEYLIKDELTPALLQRSLRHAIERMDFQRTQTALHRASRDVIQAESKPDASQLVVDAAVDVLDVSGIAIYLFDDSTNVLRPIAATDAFEAIFDGLPSFDSTEPAITWQSFVSGETISIDDQAQEDQRHRREAGVQSGIWIPLGDHGVIALVAERSDAFDQRTALLADHLAATAEATLDRIEREQSLREHEQELTHQNRQLEELNRMNELIREIDQVLVQATTCDAIEQAVCERLTQDDRFAFAWIGEVADDQLRPRTWAGDDQGYLDTVSLRTDLEGGPPSVQAAMGNSAFVAANVAGNLRRGSWRKAALARNLGSVISVPLRHADLSYGVLTVFATAPGTFDDRSTETFSELGETIANAMNSVKTRQALLSNTVVELELEITEPDALLNQIARDAECEVVYDGVVPQTDGMTRLFVTTRGPPPEDVEAVAEAVPSVKEVERISSTDDPDDVTSRFAFVVTSRTVPSDLVEFGAITRSMLVAGQTARVIVELPEGTDVRTFIDWFEQRYPDTELLARRDRERSTETQQTFTTSLSEVLTDRQLQALQTAYHSGYFEWPRERTGQEVAHSLSITQPTFNGHLRAAERKLCGMIFDNELAE